MHDRRDVHVRACAYKRALEDVSSTDPYSRNCMNSALKEIQLWRCKVGDSGTTHLASLLVCALPGAI